MSWGERLRVPQTSPGNRWINYDIRPIESSRRTWGFLTFNNFWILINLSIPTYLTGSALIPLGLTWWQAIICIVIGNILATIFLVVNSLPGAYYNLGFPVVNRSVWGMWGSQFPIWNRIFLALVWYGFNSWVGGECVYVMLQAMDVNIERHVKNTMPAGMGVTTAQFIAYIVFFVVCLPVALIRPHKLNKFILVTSAITVVFFLALLIWALATMGPAGFGDTISGGTGIPKTGGSNSVAWLSVYGIVSTIGSIAAGILSQNDYARFAKRPRHAIAGQAFSFPFYSIICSVIGILVTAATQHRFGGEAIWSPPLLLSRLITENPTAGTRAGTFFAGLAITLSQIGLNVPGGALIGGFDLAATFPEYINIRRGAYIVIFTSIAVNPWKLVSTPTVFLTVLSSYSVFLAPMTGIMVASYLVVNKRKLNTDDLYRSDKSGIYWYTFGVNWRAPVSWIVGIAPIMPGFVASVNKSISIPDSLIQLYFMSYIYGFFSSAVVYVVLHVVFPAPSLDTFVKSEASATETIQKSKANWENLDYRPWAVGDRDDEEDDASHAQFFQGISKEPAAGVDAPSGSPGSSGLS
ncbi:NCS1 nucleoside transporter family protein [Aaosphaeria arxii CBS 175.79]|uniref:NCS1 nucleoside transporter family protein n=1 Tax=Aaosphaeria arxii CBS 175.79 TaxID=1450172 RepID=A0A6A5X948_9PLEO|nr:NCS1 nucleoside transporter family protein [Aaosphaeria arxii CBS 175.79]KAF2009429.1 NCS1 nucleoside transporter family protein [Aaosphaeria arxii CBS 175.79]